MPLQIQTNETAIASDGYIGKTDMAQRLHRSTRTVEIWMRNGRLPYLKVGNAVMFHWPSVVKHLNETYQQCHRPLHGLSRRKQRAVLIGREKTTAPTDQDQQAQPSQADN